MILVPMDATGLKVVVRLLTVFATTTLPTGHAELNLKKCECLRQKYCWAKAAVLKSPGPFRPAGFITA